MGFLGVDWESLAQNPAIQKLHPATVEMSVLIWPVVVYWVVAGFYDVLDHLQLPILERCRIKRKEPSKGNLVSKGHVVWRVLLQHLLQTVLGLAILFIDPETCDAKPPQGWARSSIQFFLGMVVIDAWQYFIHRAAHESKFLYKHVHSTHHRLLIPYAYGALYNHPIEALVLDSLGAVVAHYTTGMSCHTARWLFAFATMKTVIDHCGYKFPVNPIHNLFPNTASYHDVHHDLKGIKKNFSQPFFTYWDHLLGTYMDPATLLADDAAAPDVKKVVATKSEGKKKQ